MPTPFIWRPATVRLAYRMVTSLSMRCGFDADHEYERRGPNYDSGEYAMPRGKSWNRDMVIQHNYYYYNVTIANSVYLAQNS